MLGLTALINGGVGALLGGALTLGVMWGHEAMAVSAARRAAEAQGVVTCNARIGQIEHKHNEAVSEAVEAARAAAMALPPPTTLEEIRSACKASESCRSRGAL